MKNRGIKNLILICISVAVSTLISSGADLDKQELGALASLYYPPLFGLLTLLLYFVSVTMFGINKMLITVILIICNLLFGIKMYFFG